MRILHSWLSKVGRERGEEVTRVSRSVKRTEKHKLLIRWLCLTSKRVRNRDSVRAFQLPDGEGVLAKELTGKTWIFSIVCDEKQKMLNDMTFCFVGLPSQVFHLFCCHSLCSTKISYKREREKEKKKKTLWKIGWIDFYLSGSLIRFVTGNEECESVPRISIRSAQKAKQQTSW